MFKMLSIFQWQSVPFSTRQVAPRANNFDPEGTELDLGYSDVLVNLSLPSIKVLINLSSARLLGYLPSGQIPKFQVSALFVRGFRFISLHLHTRKLQKLASYCLVPHNDMSVTGCFVWWWSQKIILSSEVIAACLWKYTIWCSPNNEIA